MRALLIAPYYVHWHYSRALRGIFDITANFIWFFWHFFSISLLLRTFFDPWQRLHEDHKRGLDIEGYLSSVVLNLVMRLVGITIRLIFILVGLVAIVLALIGGIVALTVWMILPAAIVFVFIFGFILLFRPV
ncbi:MAG: hypothetical protein K0S38_270 [Candidatus Paceibacter sp.]|jgi:hypothetical protein|nr:hypothetical protein [Candidatus Paceibacter sp.]